jgi:uncharacterized protein YceK
MLKLVCVAAWIVLLSGCTSTQLHAQGRVGSNRSASQATILGKPQAWNPFNVRLFKDSEMELTFTLRTSWIPGEEHKGMFRYQITAAPSTVPLAQLGTNPSIYTPDAVENFMKRANSCAMYLELNDEDGFLLRELLVSFSYGTNKDAKINGLFANSSTQMDATDYMKLLGDTKSSGNWTILWSCGDL